MSILVTSSILSSFRLYTVICDIINVVSFLRRDTSVTSSIWFLPYAGTQLVVTSLTWSSSSIAEAQLRAQVHPCWAHQGHFCSQVQSEGRLAGELL